MSDYERFAGVLQEGDSLHSTWEAVISRRAVCVIFPHQHWERAALLPTLADGRSRLETDVDAVADAVRRGLRLQLGLGILSEDE